MTEKMLLMVAIFGGGRREAKRALNKIRKIKEEDRDWMEKFLSVLEVELQH